MPGSGESFTPRIHGSGDSSAIVQISSQPVSVSVMPTSVPAHGIPQLGFRSHPAGLSAPEATKMTFSFRPVYATMSIKPTGPCQPTQALAGPIFLVRMLRFTWTSLHRGGAPIWGIPRFWVPGPVFDRELHINFWDSGR